MNMASACAAHHEQRIDAQEVFDDMVRTTVKYWKARKDTDEIEKAILDHLADPYQFAQLAILAHLEGKGAEFLESQLTAFAVCEVNDGE